VIHVITNREQSALMSAVGALRDVTPHIFELAEKDGYLATNSLLLDAIVVARAFAELDGSDEGFPATFEELHLDRLSIEEWIASAKSFVGQVATRPTLTILFAPSLRPVAADLESKLSEAALVHVQLADFRTFAHGRHLWLSDRPEDCAILALVDAPLNPLWQYMRSRLPAGIPVTELQVDASAAVGTVAALVAGLRLVSLLGDALGKDPGRPQVPAFGRELYYANVSTLIAPDSVTTTESGEAEKFAVLGTRWPYFANRGAMRRARQNYQTEIERQAFRAVVFDYDGTLRTSQHEDLAPTRAVVRELCRLTQAGIVVGIVSGRGGSLRDRLREAIDPAEWPRIHLGLYNGGWQTTLDAPDDPAGGTSEFLNHVSRIARTLQLIGVPIRAVKPTPPYQVSIRFRDGVDTEAMWFVVGDALRQAGLGVAAMVRSRHSIDVLAPDVSKSHVIANLIQKFRLFPHELLAIGDQGAWPGNDAALLEHRCSLSVDMPSRRLDRGWKLAPEEKRGVDATLWYLERTHLTSAAAFTVSFDRLRNDNPTNE
jgi:hypothetical protein